jgi:hypothetical protein
MKLKTHSTPQEAYKETVSHNTHAVVVVTFQGEYEKTREYYSFKSRKDEYMNAEELANDFPLVLGSNQYIREIDQFDTK